MASFDADGIDKELRALGQRRAKALKRYRQANPTKEQIAKVAARALALGVPKATIAGHLRISRTQFYRDYLPDIVKLVEAEKIALSLGPPPEPLAKRGN